MKKILLLTLEYPPDKGGVARYLHDLHVNFPNVIVKRAKIWRLWPKWIPMIGQAINCIFKDKIDLLSVSHVLPVGYVALLMKWFFGKKYIIFVHGLDVLSASKNKWKKYWLKIILLNAKQVIANSNYTKKIVSDLGVNNVTELTPCISNLPIINEPTSERENFTLLTVSRLVARKNHKIVIEAIAKIKNDFKNIRYNIVGNGPEKNNLLNQIKYLGLIDNVTIYDNVSDDDLKNFYQSADLFILPSVSDEKDAEGFGIVYLEASSFYLPVIAGKGGGVEEAVLNNKTGIIIDPKNLDDIVGAITKILSNNELRKQLGANGRKRIASEFKCENRRILLKNIYEQ